MQPLGMNDNTVSNSWDNSYTILNTDKWRPPLHVNKVCKQERQCPICPSITSGYPLNVMEYDNDDKTENDSGEDMDILLEEL